MRTLKIASMLVTAALSLSSIAVTKGTKVTVSEFPWTAYINYNSKYNCTAVILSKRHLLTAAHCFESTDMAWPELIIAKAGSPDKNGKLVALPKVKEVKIKNFQNWDLGKKVNDIAIVVLEKDIKYAKDIQPVVLPKNKEQEELLLKKNDLKLAGWGMDENSIYPNDLLSLQNLELIPVAGSDYWSVAENVAKINYNSDDIETYLTGQYLGFWVKEGRSSCGGDSGGPLTSGNILIGISSHGTGPTNACIDRTAFFYTRTIIFLDWIKEVLAH